MSRPKIKPIDQPRLFEPHELFFSTTTPSGVIRFGNDVFCRIAGYPLEEMVGCPHSLVRHPDMPRAAFKLFWDFLLRGETVAAYVKNLAQDGCHYWVLALAMPCEGGFLSIRLKPDTELFQTAQKIYERVLKTEVDAEAAGATRAEALDAGVARLHELLHEASFPDYKSFMYAALSAEMTQRTEHLAKVPQLDTSKLHHDRLVSLFERAQRLDQQLGDNFVQSGAFSRLRDEIIPKSASILELGNSIRLLALNAGAESARLGVAARALVTIAERLGQQAGEGVETIARLNQRMRELEAPTSEVIFHAMVSKVQIEMASLFVAQVLRSNETSQQEVTQNLELLFSTFLKTARETPSMLGQLQKHLSAVSRDAQELSRFVRTLHFIYVTGSVETARTTGMESFTEIFDQIKQKIGESEAVLEDLTDQIEMNEVHLASIGEVDMRRFDELSEMLCA